MNECVVCGAPVPWMEIAEPLVVCAAPQCQRVAVASVRENRAAILGSATKPVNVGVEGERTPARQHLALWTP